MKILAVLVIVMSETRETLLAKVHKNIVMHLTGEMQPAKHLKYWNLKQRDYTIIFNNDFIYNRSTASNFTTSISTLTLTNIILKWVLLLEKAILLEVLKLEAVKWLSVHFIHKLKAMKSNKDYYVESCEIWSCEPHLS